MALFRGIISLTAWQPHAVEADGQLGQGAVPQVSGPDMVAPPAGVSKEPGLRAIMYHLWCIRT